MPAWPGRAPFSGPDQIAGKQPAGVFSDPPRCQPDCCFFLDQNTRFRLLRMAALEGNLTIGLDLAH